MDISEKNSRSASCRASRVSETMRQVVWQSSLELTTGQNNSSQMTGSVTGTAIQKSGSTRLTDGKPQETSQEESERASLLPQLSLSLEEQRRFPVERSHQRQFLSYLLPQEVLARQETQQSRHIEKPDNSQEKSLPTERFLASQKVHSNRLLL